MKEEKRKKEETTQQLIPSWPEGKVHVVSMAINTRLQHKIELLSESNSLLFLIASRRKLFVGPRKRMLHCSARSACTSLWKLHCRITRTLVMYLRGMKMLPALWMSHFSWKSVSKWRSQQQIERNIRAVDFRFVPSSVARMLRSVSCVLPVTSDHVSNFSRCHAKLDVNSKYCYRLQGWPAKHSVCWCFSMPLRDGHRITGTFFHSLCM